MIVLPAGPVQTHKAVLRLVPRLADVISRNSASFFTKMPK